MPRASPQGLRSAPGGHGVAQVAVWIGGPACLAPTLRGIPVDAGQASLSIKRWQSRRGASHAYPKMITS
jgi:hypothetical protein